MKTFLCLLLVFSDAKCKSADTVYVCDSRNAKKYHYSSACRGLSNCSYRIVKITLEEAKKQGKTLCGWEK
jgi:5-bromo-4-chloroindolyl phosphate hydrolysis protein